MVWSRVLLLGLAVTILAGCGSTARPPLYTPEELRATCERQGGWWRPSILDGYCEYQSPGFL
jgi:predicted small lipoprotein YifL